MRTVTTTLLLLAAFMLVTADNVFAAGKSIKMFKVDYFRQGDILNVKITTDLPDDTPLTIGCTKEGLKDNDRWVGCETINSKVVNRVAEGKLDITGLPKGGYELEVLFNSFWISRPTTAEPKLQAIVGEFGENIKTPYIRTFDHSGKKYRMISFKKHAFSGIVKSFMQILLKGLFSTVSMVFNYAAILSSFDTLIAARIARASFVIFTPYHRNSLSCQ